MKQTVLAAAMIGAFMPRCPSRRHDRRLVHCPGKRHDAISFGR